MKSYRQPLLIPIYRLRPYALPDEPDPATMQFSWHLSNKANHNMASIRVIYAEQGQVFTSFGAKSASSHPKPPLCIFNLKFL